jgi:hypothetical protein
MRESAVHTEARNWILILLTLALSNECVRQVGCKEMLISVWSVEKRLREEYLDVCISIPIFVPNSTIQVSVTTPPILSLPGFYICA